jgi:hypothetical protein
MLQLFDWPVHLTPSPCRPQFRYAGASFDEAAVYRITQLDTMVARAEVITAGSFWEDPLVALPDCQIAGVIGCH